MFAEGDRRVEDLYSQHENQIDVALTLFSVFRATDGMFASC